MLRNAKQSAQSKDPYGRMSPRTNRGPSTCSHRASAARGGARDDSLYWALHGPCRAGTSEDARAHIRLGRLQINGVGFLSYANSSCADFFAKWTHRVFAAHLFFSGGFRGRCELYSRTSDEFALSDDLVAAAHSPRVAWVFDAKGVRNLWVADAPDFAARQITHYDSDDGLPIASLRITADGRTLVYVRGSETNENGRVADPTNGVWPRKQQVWAIDVDAGAPRLLGEMGCAEEDCEDVQLSPDGQFAVWAARKQLWIAPVSGATRRPSAHRPSRRQFESEMVSRWPPDCAGQRSRRSQLHRNL